MPILLWTLASAPQFLPLPGLPTGTGRYLSTYPLLSYFCLFCWLITVTGTWRAVRTGALGREAETVPSENTPEVSWWSIISKTDFPPLEKRPFILKWQFQIGEYEFCYNLPHLLISEFQLLHSGLCCILSVWAGRQVWNLLSSFHESILSSPTPLLLSRAFLFAPCPSLLLLILISALG